MNTKKKYVMIVTSEDERYENDEVQLDFFWDNPWEGKLEDIVYGDTLEDLISVGDYEGLFYQLYSTETGERIGYGGLNFDLLEDDIKEWENKANKNVYETIFNRETQISTGDYIGYAKVQKTSILKNINATKTIEFLYEVDMHDNWVFHYINEEYLYFDNEDEKTEFENWFITCG